jgi:hypothetical protein
MASPLLRQLPGRLVAGAFTLHAGIEKLSATPEHAAGVHGMAAGTYPFLADVPPERFVKGLAVGEIVLGGALLAPFVPAGVAGAALTGFSASLMGLYARTPGMRKDGSVWPTPQGIGLSKDVWLLAIGAGLLADALGERRSR